MSRTQNNLYQYVQGGPKARRYLIIYEIRDDSGSCMQYHTIKADTPMLALESVRKIPDSYEVAGSVPWTELYMVWPCPQTVKSVKYWKLYEDDPPQEEPEHTYRVSYPIKKRTRRETPQTMPLHEALVT